MVPSIESVADYEIHSVIRFLRLNVLGRILVIGKVALFFTDHIIRNGRKTTELFQKMQVNNGQTFIDEEWKDLPGHEHVHFLTPWTIEKFIQSNDCVLLMFMVDWCHHCKSSKPEFAKAAKTLHENSSNSKLGAINCHRYPELFEAYQITGYPTFKYYCGGKYIGEYHYRRQANDFFHFMMRSPKTAKEL